MTHHIKLEMPFCDHVLTGRKRFEIRYNNRDYRVGDYIVFIPVDPETKHKVQHAVEARKYRITYLISGWGLEDGYVVFGIEEVNNEQDNNRGGS